jgi:hypothetical protein
MWALRRQTWPYLMKIVRGRATSIGAVVAAVSMWASCSPTDNHANSDAGGPDGSSPGSSGGASSNGASSGGSGGTSSGGTSDGGAPGALCDSGGPLALEKVWTLPTVTPTSIAVDGQGDVYVSGMFNGAASFGTTTLTAPTAPGTGNMFLVKYDGGGNVLFAKSYGTATGVYDKPMIGVDPAGNVYLGGGFSQTLDLGGGTTPLAAVTVDAFTAKISPSGQTLWADHFGYSSGGGTILSVTVGTDGNPIFAGSASGTIVLGSTTWPAPQGTEQPFILKLSAVTGSVLWSNATGGDIYSGDDIWVGADPAGRVFVAARVEHGGGAWGVAPDAGSSTLRAGFDPNGSILWGQFDYGAFPMAAAVDQAGRFSVFENAQDTVVVGGSSTFGSPQSGLGSLSVLFSPIDGTLLSGLDIGSTFAWSAAVDRHGNTLVTGTYWPKTSPIPVGGLSLPGGSQLNQPLFLAALDGQSNAVAIATLGASNDGQPLGIAVDPGSGNIYVPFKLSTAFTSSVGPLMPGILRAVFGPDPCDDGVGPLGPSTGNSANHGDLAPDGGSPYSPPDAAAPAACPSAQAGATNGAACPVAMGCSYGTTCCFCDPSPCNGQPTTWTCNSLANPDSRCPATPPQPSTSCPSGLTCNYCLPGGRFFAQCGAGGWGTGLAQILCQ